MSNLRNLLLDFIISFLFDSLTTKLEDHLDGSTVDADVQARLDAATANL